MNAAEKARQLKTQADASATQKEQAELEARKANDAENERLGILRAETQLPTILKDIEIAATGRKQSFYIEIYGFRADHRCTPSEYGYSKRMKELLINEGFKVVDDFNSQDGGGGSDPMWYGTLHQYCLDVTW